ncbi:MAG: hypothetical protein QXH55_00325 [Candidatus Korarchaeota archaeon]|nr:DUF11 domain-containing protein [Thermoproteota archaeon]MCR8462593.1 DUF11 domain-containing protein [Thermoproteota archaeon]
MSRWLRFTLLCCLILILFLSLPWCHTSHEPGSCVKCAQINISQKTEIKYPLIFATKVAPRKVNVGDPFKVSIIVSNLGNDTAYNLTIIDENYPEWTLETYGYYRNYFINELKPNISVIVEYNLSIKLSKQEELSLGRVKVNYFDSKGKMFTVISDECVVYLEGPKKSADVRHALTVLSVYTLAVIVPMIIILMMNDYKVYREYVKASKLK